MIWASKLGKYRGGCWQLGFLNPGDLGWAHRTKGKPSSTISPAEWWHMVTVEQEIRELFRVWQGCYFLHVITTPFIPIWTGTIWNPYHSHLLMRHICTTSRHYVTQQPPCFVHRLIISDHPWHVDLASSGLRCGLPCVWSQLRLDEQTGPDLPPVDEATTTCPARSLLSTKYHQVVHDSPW